jgi:prepilin-type N-terminal cleavage/methylation domain-containing protein
LRRTISLASLENKKMKNKKGFTLSELLIVVAIISTMTVVSLTYLGQNKKSRDLENSTREVTAAFREAQNDALTGKTSDANNYPCFYRLKIESRTDYSLNYIYHVKGDTVVTDCSKPGLSTSKLATYTLKNLVQFDAMNADGTTYDYQVPHNLSQANPILIRLNQNGKTHDICIYPSGDIKDGDNLAPTCTP